MGKKSSPKAPDYEGAAKVDAQASKENTQMQTYANRPNQINPWGSTSWTNQQVWDPATQQNVTQWSQVERLDPNIQAALDSQVDVQRGRSDLAGGMLSRVGAEIGQPVDWSKFGDMTAPSDTPMFHPNELATGYDQAALQQTVDMGGLKTGYQQRDLQEGYETGDYRKGYEQDAMQRQYDQEGLQRDIGVDPMQQLQSSSDAMFNQAKSRLDPQFQAEEEALEIKLRNQGLRRGDQAYEAALSALNTRKTDAYNQANMSAMMQGAQDASRMFNMYGQAGDFANQATNQTNQNIYQQAQFGNQAAQQDNMNRAAQAGFFNQAQGMQNQDAAAQAAFANQAATQMNQQDAAQAAFFNQGQQGMNENALAQANLFNQATGQMNQAQADQANFYNQAQQGMNAQNLAGSQYNQDAQYRQADYANQLRQSQIKEEMTRRGFSLNEVNALLSGQQVQNPSFENFSPATKADTPNMLGAATAQGNFDTANAGSSGGFMSGLGSLAQGGAAMYGAGMFSDRRLKRNIKRIGTLLGYPLYIFDYIWGKTAIGFMSDEVNQDAVSVHPSGYDWIDLSLIREKS